MLPPPTHPHQKKKKKKKKKKNVGIWRGLFLTAHTYTQPDTTKLGFYFISFFSFPSHQSYWPSPVYTSIVISGCAGIWVTTGAAAGANPLCEAKRISGAAFSSFQCHALRAGWGAVACVRLPFRLKDIIATSSVFNTAVRSDLKILSPPLLCSTLMCVQT